MQNLKSKSLLLALGLMMPIGCQQQEENTVLSSTEAPARDSVTSKTINGLTYFIPRERTADLIVFNYGFGSGAFGGFAYPATPRALAEAGFAVVLNTASGVDQFGGGPKTVATIVAIAEADLGDPNNNLTLTDNIGVIGHSMGGGTAGRLVSDLAEEGAYEVDQNLLNRIKAAVAIQPAYLQPIPDGGRQPKSALGGLAGAAQTFGPFADWIMPIKVHKTIKPTAFLGGDQVEWGDGENPYLSYNRAETDAFVAEDPSADHLWGRETPGYSKVAVEWFRCYLSNDEQACDIFRSQGNNRPSICANSELNLKNCAFKEGGETNLKSLAEPAE